jgi:hypothetical protein
MLGLRRVRETHQGTVPAAGLVRFTHPTRVDKNRVRLLRGPRSHPIPERPVGTPSGCVDRTCLGLASLNRTDQVGKQTTTTFIKARIVRQVVRGTGMMSISNADSGTGRSHRTKLCTVRSVAIPSPAVYEDLRVKHRAYQAWR